MESRSVGLYKVVFVFISIITSILLTYQIYLELNNKELNDNYDEVVVLSNNTSDIDKEIDFYNNIDTKLQERYDEYYTNIRTFEEKVKNKETDKKIAYLTFDDGPYQLTNRVLDILKEKNAKATFFVLGKESTKDRYIRQVNEGHVLANHTYYHNIRGGLYKSKDSFIEQVDKLENYLYDVTGYRTTLVRFPGGEGTAKYFKIRDATVEALHEKGYKYVNWTCETGDGSDARLKEKSEWEWYKSTCTQDIIVLLMHDYHKGTVDILDKIIDDLRERNYVILPLSNKSIMAN